MNIAQNIEQARRLFPNRIGLEFEGQTYSFLEMDRLVNQAANVLQEGLGVQKGDRVALYLPNIPAFAFCYLAIQKIGAIAVSINAMNKAEEVIYVLNDCTARVVVTTEKLRENVPEGELPSLERVLVAEGKAPASERLDELLMQASSHLEAVPMSWDDPAALVYTSGTTGYPKGVTLSHRNVISNAVAKKHYCGMRPGSRMLLFLPLFHCFGQNAILNSGIYSCATTVLQRRFEPELALQTVRDRGINMFFGVPTIYIRLLNMDMSRFDLSNITYYFSAAATLPKETALRWCEAYGQVIHQGYGLTESSPFASYNHEYHYKFGSVGSPIDFVQMRIVDTTSGLELGPHQPGEICIKGPNVMLGYWNRPAETAKIVKNGWLHSGDIGTVDEQGYFYIVDRLKDMINVSGFNVYPAEVENSLYKHPDVAEVAVYGVADPVKGEIVKARVVPRQGKKPSSEELTAFCRAHMANYKIPASFELVDELPKNAPGKILKHVIQAEEAAK